MLEQLNVVSSGWQLPDNFEQELWGGNRRQTHTGRSLKFKIRKRPPRNEVEHKEGTQEKHKERTEDI